MNRNAAELLVELEYQRIGSVQRLLSYCNAELDGKEAGRMMKKLELLGLVNQHERSSRAQWTLTETGKRIAKDLKELNDGGENS